MSEVKEYDSTYETKEHIGRVQHFLKEFIIELSVRGDNHDKSKLEPPEKEYFDKYTPLLKNLEYGTEEYRSQIENLKPAIKHHYEVNTHHPQHYPDGINGMDLFDVMEMLADWRAATERSKGGDIRKSLEIAAERQGISKQLKSILSNTIERYPKIFDYDI